MTSENYINHVALVLDASSSMRGLERTVIKVADEQVAYLAKRSTELDQETRITLYSFADNVDCMVYDKDALRLPSIQRYYRPSGMTALLDATSKAIDDLEKTAQLYGDHAFLVYVLTDGQENRSRKITVEQISKKLKALSENWTVACLVPDIGGKILAEEYGFPAENIAVWETTERGLTEASNTILRATNSYMTSRATGVRGTKTLFSTSVDTLNKNTVKTAGLKVIPKDQYERFDIKEGDSLTIRDFVEAKGYNYVQGCAYYQLSKPENIQPQKEIVVRNKKTGRFYTGAEARELIGLRPENVRVKPDKNPEFDVFVQSTSVNRRLVPGTKLLVFVS